MSNKLLLNLKSNDKSPEFYQNYSRLFCNYYKEINFDTIKFLCNAGYLYYHSILLTDELVDNKNYSNLSLISIYQEETIKILTSIYGVDSVFWKYWKKRKKEYFEAIKIEYNLYLDDKIDFKTYTDLADKKSSFGKIAIDSLYILSVNKNKKKHKTLLKSHKYFSVGFQLYDDVKDFKEDLKNEQFNWAIYILKKQINFSDYNNNISVLHKLLFIEGIGQKLLKKSIKYFCKSLEILNDFKNESEWRKIIIEMKETIENYLDITNGYIKVIQKKIELKKEVVESDYFFDFSEITNITIKKGLHFIKTDFLNNFSELKHVMYLSKNEGFENLQDIHYSDTFQRAILNDCLLNVTMKWDINAKEYFKIENNYLVSKVSPFVNSYGWSYFPTVKELAPDIDDLAQIMQLFIKTKNINLIEKYCLKPLKVCLSDRLISNGGIETWIIPAKNKTILQEKQEYFNKTKWGKGPDVEVVANFIFSLEIYDSVQYNKYIKKSIEYILNQQNKGGYWTSRWYYGNFYGTYLCLRLLKKYRNKYFKQIQRGLKYILDSQLSNGGFISNDNRKPDALSTAYALLALKLFLTKSHNAVVLSENYLIKSQNINGYWQESNFIKPKIQEPYKSRTLTTAIVLKALCNE